MTKKESIVKGFTIYLLGNLGSKFSGLLLLPFYTYYLTKAQYGYFEIVNAAVMMLLPLIAFQMYEGTIRYLLDSDEGKSRSQVIASSFFPLLLNALIFSAIYLIVVQFLEFPHKYYILLFFLAVFFNFYLQRTARGLQYQTAFALSGFISGLLIAGFSYLALVHLRMREEGIILAYAIGNGGSALFLIQRTKFFSLLSKAAFSMKLTKEIIKYSYPLLFDAVCWWVMNLSDRLLLGELRDAGEVGIYSVANRFAAILVFVNSVFYLVWQEFAILKSREKEKEKEYADVFNTFAGLQFSAIIFLLPFSKAMILLFIDTEFQEAYLYLPYLLGGALFSGFAAFYGLRYQTAKKTLGALYTSFAGAVLNIVLNIIFIPMYGILAAAVTTVISFFVMWLLRLTGKDGFINLRDVSFVKMAFYLALFVIVALIVDSADEMTLYGMLVVTLFLFFSINKRVIINILNYVASLRK